MTDQKNDYPKMPAKQWWALRNRFKQSIPTTVTARYLATVLGMEEISADKNLLPALRRVGLIDQEGRPQELAKRWRDDHEYPQVCEEIRQEVYPSELLDAVPDPSANRDAATRWFGKSGAGSSLVEKRVAFYQLLSEADPAKGQKNQEGTRPSSIAKVSSRKPKIITPNNSRSDSTPKQDSTPTQESTNGANEASKRQDNTREANTQEMPQLHIDIQIHISPDASPDQIDQIFASMAKHLYKRGSVNG